MRKTRKFVPALAMLLVSAMIASTASFAWFSMNRETLATGMIVNAVAPTDLIISNLQGDIWDGTTTVNEIYLGKLIPASSSNGFKFNGILDNKNVLGFNGIGGHAVDGKTHMKNSTEIVAMAGAENGWYAEYTLRFKIRNESDAGSTVKVYLSQIVTTVHYVYTELDKLYLASNIREGDDPVLGVFGSKTYYTALNTSAVAGLAVLGTTYYIENYTEDDTLTVDTPFTAGKIGGVSYYELSGSDYTLTDDTKVEASTEYYKREITDYTVTNDKNVLRVGDTFVDGEFGGVAYFEDEANETPASGAATSGTYYLNTYSTVNFTSSDEFSGGELDGVKYYTTEDSVTYTPVADGAANDTVDYYYRDSVEPLAATVLREGDDFTDGAFGGTTYYADNELEEKAGTILRGVKYYSYDSITSTFANVDIIPADKLRVGDTFESGVFGGVTYYTAYSDDTETGGTLASGTATNTTYYTRASLENCVRVALFKDDTSTASNLLAIYAVDEDTSVLPISAGTVYDAADNTFNTTDLAAADPMSKVGIVYDASSVDITPSFEVGETEQVIVVRIWIEGEHPECLNGVNGIDAEEINISLKFESYN